MEINSMNARLTFENARALLASTVGTNAAANARLTSSYVRAEVNIQTNLATYQLQTLSNQPNNANVIYNTERRIQLQDWFIASQIGVFLGVPSSGTDTTFKLLTFPDASILTTIGASAAAYTLYNGYLNLTIDNNVVMPEWDLDRHLYIPVTQPAANADYTTSGINYIGNRDGSIHGYFPCEPNLIFNGAANLDFKLVLPSAIATAQTGGFSRIIVIMRGVKAQNVTSVR
jgi:hypothetical protein